MSIYSRHKHYAERLEVKSDISRRPEVRELQPPLNRRQRRAREKAERSQRKLLVTRRTK